MHILIATPYLPWPLNAGGRVAQFSTLECLSKDHSFTIICPVNSPKEVEGIEEIERRLPNVRVRAVPFYNVHIPSSLRSGVRNIRQFFQSSSKPDSEDRSPEYPFAPLRALFIDALKQELEANVDLLQVEFAEMLSLSTLKVSTNIPKIFINHQIHWVYAQRYLQVHGLDPESSDLVNRIRSEEAILLSGFDSIVVFSETDAKEMSTLVDKNKIHISPFPIPFDIDPAVDVTTKHLFIKNFTFVGSEAHFPNRDAIEWLLSDIWPLIRASIPQAQLFIIGNWSKKWLSNHQSDNVVYTGFVENIADIMQDTIQLVPVRIGSGIRTKILTAMALKAPVVSTTIGIEGINIQDLEHAIIRDAANDFASGAVALATDSILARRLANQALKFVWNNYSYEVVRKTRNLIYEAATLKKYERDNV